MPLHIVMLTIFGSSENKQNHLCIAFYGYIAIHTLSVCVYIYSYKISAVSEITYESSRYVAIIMKTFMCMCVVGQIA